MSDISKETTSPGKKPEDRTLLSLLRDFCGYTTFGGLGRVSGSPYLFFRVIWLALFLAGLVMAVVQLESLYRKYQEKPVSTKISLHYKQPLTFPTVTVCNFNIIRKSYVEDISSEILRNYFENTFIKKKNRTTTPEESTAGEGGAEEDDEGFENPEDLDKDYKLNEIISMAIARAQPEDLIPLGHQFDDMIVSCTWRGVNCKKNYTSGKFWGSFWHYRFGNCFVFNPLNDWNGKVRKSARNAYRSGPSNGLKLQLNIEQAEYIDQLTQKAGAVIQVSPHGQMPFPDEEGISVAPGYSTLIALRKVEIHRVDPFKNRSCVEKITAEDRNNLYYMYYNASYSKTACFESCVAYYQFEECGCMEYRFPMTKNHTVCDTLDRTTVSCLRKINLLLTQRKLNCTSLCPSPCSEETYQTSSSFAAWPSVNYQANIGEEMKEQLNFTSSNGFRDNILEVQIFYKELNYQVIKEIVSYEFVNFLADIGGQLGLWVGVSVLTLAEVVELIIFIIMHMCKRKPRINNNTAAEDNSKNDVYAMSM